MDEITIGDKLYVSSKRAAQITGYAKDYIGQLCREGRVEARLVGRNWYVLDTALRAHRFGKEDASVEEEKQDSAPVSPISTWKRPEYVPEVPAYVPVLAPKASRTESSETGSPAVVDMQTAWKEWFEEKKTVNATENEPEESIQSQVYLQDQVVDTGEEVERLQQEPEEQFEVPINRINEEIKEAEPEVEVEIHRSYSTSNSASVRSTPKPYQSYEFPSQTTDYGSSVQTEKRSSLALNAAFIVISIAALLIAMVGSGQADRLLGGTSINFGVQKDIIEYLGGKSKYESSL